MTVMDAKYCSSAESTICNEATIKQSLLRRSYRNKELSSASSISPSMSVSVVENSVTSQFSTFCQMNEIDRLVSDQGLITPKERLNTSQRRVRDKSYYKGIVRIKSKEIVDEIRKLQKEIAFLSVEQRMYVPYKEKAESKAIDLQNLQKVLIEYNLLDDMLCRDIQLIDVKKELQELKTANMKENENVETLFALLEQKEIKIKDIETNISQKNDISEILTITIDPEVSEKLKSLKRKDYRLQILRTQQEEVLMDLIKERICIENQCHKNEIKKEGLELFKKLWISEEKRNELHSRNNFTSSEEEYEYLQKYETECNVLLKGMIQEKQNVDSKIKNIMDELKKMDNKFYNPHLDRSLTLAKLRKHEKVIEEFFSCCNDEEHELFTKQQQQENIIVELLKEVSTKISSFDPDSHDDCDKRILSNDPMIQKIKMENVKVLREWEDCCNIEPNALKELQDRKAQVKALESKILAISNIAKAKDSLKAKKKKLLNELTRLKKQKSVWKCFLSDLKKRHDSLENQLKNNETYTILSKLEKRWHLLEKENYAIGIASKDFRSEYLLLKNNVRNLYSELNKML